MTHQENSITTPAAQASVPPVNEQSLVYRLRKRAEIRRQIPGRKSVQEGARDRISDLLEESANELDKFEAQMASPEFMALIRDANRYRFIREWRDSDELIKDDCRGLYVIGREALDAAVDAAMMSASAAPVQSQGEGVL